jgi:hypothetical protein
MKENIKKTNQAIELLDRLLETSVSKAGKTKRSDRTIECLKSPEDDDGKDWHACLPPCFNDALDIRRTEVAGQLIWTQGSAFSFKKGDVIYIGRQSRSETDGNEEAQSFRQCIQITAAGEAKPASAEEPRDPGKVVFCIYKCGNNGTSFEPQKFVEMTQDDLVSFLISGDFELKADAQRTLFG